MENNDYRERMKQERELREQMRLERCGKIGWISVIYALAFTVCLYKNFSGITSPVWAIFTAFYLHYAGKKLEGNWTGVNTLMNIAIILFGFSNFFTDNRIMIFINYVAIIVLIIINVLCVFIDMSSLNVTKHLLAMLQGAAGSIAMWGEPFTNIGTLLSRNKKDKNDKTKYAIVGIIVAIPVVISIGLLLATADSVFGNMLEDIGKALAFDNILSNWFGALVMLTAGYVLPYSYLTYVQKGQICLNNKARKTEPIGMIIVSGAVSLLYVLFSLIQIVYLFMGKGELPKDYTYAEYAREGFFQLLFVSAFNVLLVLVCIEFFKESKVLRAVLTVISICTFIMIASSAYRMGMYISEYGLTFLRVFVLWTLAVIALMMAGLLITLYVSKFKLFRYGLVVITVCTLVLTYSHMDYFIAKYDLNRENFVKHQVDEETRELLDCDVDCSYLMMLSADAAPALQNSEKVSEYMKKHEIDINYVRWLYQEYKEDGEVKNKMTFRNFNVSRYMARLGMDKKQ